MQVPIEKSSSRILLKTLFFFVLMDLVMVVEGEIFLALVIKFGLLVKMADL